MEIRAQTPLTGNAGEILTVHNDIDIAGFRGPIHEGFRFLPGGLLMEIRHVGHYEGQETGFGRGLQYRVNQLSGGVDCVYCVIMLDFTTVLANGDAPTMVSDCEIGTTAGQMLMPRLTPGKNPGEHKEAVVAGGCRGGNPTFIVEQVKQLGGA